MIVCVFEQVQWRCVRNERAALVQADPAAGGHFTQANINCFLIVLGPSGVDYLCCMTAMSVNHAGSRPQRLIAVRAAQASSSACCSSGSR